MKSQNASAVIINDHQLVNDMFCVMLKGFGLEVIASFIDVEPGVTYVIQTQPSLVLLDMTMPFPRSPVGIRTKATHPYLIYDSQASFAAARQIRTSRPHTKILMITGERHPNLYIVGFNAGVDGIASKFDGLQSFHYVLQQVMAGESRITSERMQIILQDYPLTPIPALIPAEIRILELVQEGLESPVIGRRLGYAAKTIRNMLSSINKKLGTNNRYEAVEMAIEMGLVGWRTGFDG